MKAEFDTPPGTCGVGIMYDFGDEYADYDILRGTPGGCGWLMAGFISGNRKCLRAFRALAKKYKVVYKSPRRVNVNSGNNFYFAIFDTKGTDARIGFDKWYGYDDDENEDENFGPF